MFQIIRGLLSEKFLTPTPVFGVILTLRRRGVEIM